MDRILLRLTDIFANTTDYVLNLKKSGSCLGLQLFPKLGFMMFLLELRLTCPQIAYWRHADLRHL